MSALVRPCSFKGAHVAITGGGSGIGLELARHFLQQAAAGVSLLDISDCAAALADLGAERSRHPNAQGRLVSCRADVTDYQQACPLPACRATPRDLVPSSTPTGAAAACPLEAAAT